MISWPEVQDNMTEWHGLDPSKFGDLKLSGRFSTAPGTGSWQPEADCFLFDNVLVITMEQEPSKRKLKGSVLLKDVKDVKSVGDPAEVLEMHLTVEKLPMLRLRCEDISQVDTWKGELREKIGGAK